MNADECIAALEGAPRHIRVNSISPGAIATPMWESTDLWPKQVSETGGRDAALKALVKDRGYAEPEEVAAAVLFLASDDAGHVNVREHPYQAIGIAFGVGVLIGVLVARSRRE